MSDAITSNPTSVPEPPADVPDPNPSPPPVPWDARELVFLLFFAFLVFFTMIWPSVVNDLLRGAGFFDWYYGKDAANAEERKHLWAVALPFPLQVATILVLVVPMLGARLAALGLTCERLGRNLLLGFASAVVLTPVVIGLNLAVVWLYKHGLGIEEQKHPLAKVGEMHLTGLEWGLWLFAAIVVAPVVEELLFRGVFQPAAGKSRAAGAAGVVLAVVLTVALRQEQFANAWNLVRAGDWSAARTTVLDALAPVAFLVFLSLLLVAAIYFRRDGAANYSLPNHSAPAILGTSILFAMVHVSVWPSPIALFVLALGLGWLRERSGSLVGSIVLHSLFNAVNCAILLLRLS